MIYANEDECLAAGVNAAKIESLARRLRALGDEAGRLRITIFGGSGSGSLRFDDGNGRKLILAEIGGNMFDGGDGAQWQDEEGLLRGE